MSARDHMTRKYLYMGTTDGNVHEVYIEPFFFFTTPFMTKKCLNKE